MYNYSWLLNKVEVEGISPWSSITSTYYLLNLGLVGGHIIFFPSEFTELQVKDSHFTVSGTISMFQAAERAFPSEWNYHAYFIYA